MTEITRVPLQPIAKGSLAKLWIAVIVALLVGVGVAWAAVPKGTDVTTLQAGTGPTPGEGDVVFLTYTGKLPDGTVFDQSQPLPIPTQGLFPEGMPFPLEEGAAIPGFLAALEEVQKGGRYVFEIPAKEAYGDAPPPGAPIPPGSDLVFDIEVTEVMTRDDFDRRLAQLQQMMQQGAPQGPGGVPEAVPAPQPEAAPAPAN